MNAITKLEPLTRWLVTDSKGKYLIVYAVNAAEAGKRALLNALMQSPIVVETQSSVR